MINDTLRPKPDALPEIYTTLGQDYDDRVNFMLISFKFTAPMWVPIWRPGFPWGPFSVLLGPHFLF